MNPRGGRISTLFRNHWNERTVSAAARTALNSLIPRSSLAAIPVNVETAARYVGIERIVDSELSNCDGLLSATPSGSYVATLATGQTNLRRRFTLAHEIGHAVVYRSIGRIGDISTATELRCRPETVDGQDEERLCDILATELLMPRDRFVEVMEDSGVCATTVPVIARQFGVSLQAASRRIATTLSYEIAIGMWTLNDQRTHVAPYWYLTAKGATSLPYAIAIGQPGSELFTEQTTRGWHWLPLHGQMEKYFVDVCPLRGGRASWLLMVVFSSAAQQILSTISKGRARALQSHRLELDDTAPSPDDPSHG